MAPCLGLGHDIADEDWPLDWIGVAFFLPFDNNGGTDHMSSHIKVEQ
jgi:hypothetical protein